MAPDNGAHDFKTNAQRFCKNGAWFFQIGGLLTSGTFNCDKKKVLYFEQKGARQAQGRVQIPVNDVKMILHWVERFH